MLTLSKNKCYRIHISGKNRARNKSQNCTALKVHEDKMSDSIKEKYLSDIIDNTEKQEQHYKRDRKRVMLLLLRSLQFLRKSILDNIEWK